MKNRENERKSYNMNPVLFFRNLFFYKSDFLLRLFWRGGGLFDVECH